MAVAQVFPAGSFTAQFGAGDVGFPNPPPPVEANAKEAKNTNNMDQRFVPQNGEASKETTSRSGASSF